MAYNFKKRYCLSCGVEYIPKGARQKFCKGCMPKKSRKDRYLNPTSKLRWLVIGAANAGINHQGGIMHTGREIKILQQWWESCVVGVEGEWRDIEIVMG